MTTTVNLLPTGDGALTDWTASGAATRWECIDDPIATPDDFTTLVSESTDGGRNTVTIAAATGAGTIDNLTVHARFNQPGGANALVRIFVRVGGVNYDGSQFDIAYSPDFANYTQVWTRNPASGERWTNAILTASEIGAVFDEGSQIYLTQIYASVVYSVSHQVNSGTMIPGVSANWQRQAKRTNDDGSVDWQDYAILSWEIPQATMEVYEELRAVQGKVLTNLVSTDIDNRNEPKLYSYAELISVVQVQQVGRRATGLRAEFRVKV